MTSPPPERVLLFSSLLSSGRLSEDWSLTGQKEACPATVICIFKVLKMAVCIHVDGGLNPIVLLSKEFCVHPQSTLNPLNSLLLINMYPPLLHKLFLVFL